MNFGKILTETSEEYHGQDCVSASKLRVFKRRPGGAALYYQCYISKTLDDPDTAAKIEGRALHTLVLEPEKFEAQFSVLPEDAPARPTAAMRTAKKPSASSIARVKWWDEWERQSAGKESLGAEIAAKLRGMAGMIAIHPAASVLLQTGEAEVSWRVKAGGLKHLPPLQCRTDWFCEHASAELAEFMAGHGVQINEGEPYVVDIKSCATLEEAAFGNFHRAVEDHIYHVQSALYMEILSALRIPCHHFFFIAAEKCAPYGVEVYHLAERELIEGQRVAAQLLIDLDRCFGRSEWPNTSPAVKELKLSARYWAKKDEQYEG